MFLSQKNILEERNGGRHLKKWKNNCLCVSLHLLRAVKMQKTGYKYIQCDISNRTSDGCERISYDSYQSVFIKHLEE